MLTYKEIREFIERNDSIVIFRHIHGDYDAYGAQLGLKELIKNNYPEKEVYSAGDRDIINPDFLDDMDNPDVETISRSLCIIVDTSTRDRVENKDYLLSGNSIRIDHHPYAEEICKYEMVDPSASSASQLIVELAMDSGWSMSARAAVFLYAGISSDTLKMTIDKVDERLFLDLAFLMKSHFSVNKVNRAIYDQNTELFNKETQLRTRIRFDGDIAYLVLSDKDLKIMNLTYREAKDMVNIMGNIAGIEKYAMFVEYENGYGVSLRSHTHPISWIAEKYGGGGHLNASGISSVKEEDIKYIVKLLKEA